jgi:dTMP kinase
LRPEERPGDEARTGGRPSDPAPDPDADAETEGPGTSAPDAAASAEIAADAVRAATAGGSTGWVVRLFSSRDFFRLWLAQVIQAMGDWVGLLAISFLASEVGGGSGTAAIGFVLAARLLPGLFLAPLAGVMVDRWDRKKVLVFCNIGRAGVVLLLPFVTSVGWLVVASLALETMTLLWGPAKEATVPNLVRREYLTTANSLGLAAAYGTFPLASAVFALLASVSGLLSGISAIEFLRTDKVAVAFGFQAAAFLVSAAIISGLAIPRRPKVERGAWRVDWARPLHELQEGWHYIFINPTVRAVNLGLATGLVGGGMLIPLGAVFSNVVLGAGADGYGLFTTALGFGVASGVVLVSVVQRRINQKEVFAAALLVAGAALFVAASAGSLTVSAAFVFLMGAAVGPVYVLGYATLQAEVDDDLRGRVFAALNTLVRLCILLSMVLGPFLATVLGRADDATDPRTLDIGSFTIALPGVRVTLWIAALIIMAAGLVARHALSAGMRRHHATVASHPSSGSGQ